jgi:hypothetical protein
MVGVNFTLRPFECGTAACGECYFHHWYKWVLFTHKLVFSFEDTECFELSALSTYSWSYVKKFKYTE